MTLGLARKGTGLDVEVCVLPKSEAVRTCGSANSREWQEQSHDGGLRPAAWKLRCVGLSPLKLNMFYKLLTHGKLHW